MDFDFAKLRPEILLDEGQTYPLGRFSIRTIRAPGHSSGCICFHVGNALFTGDVLFRGSTGRTDLPGGGGPDVMAGSLRRIFELFPDETMVYPGHNELTDIGTERKRIN
jgi:hydroxyacylglutathione hydrolase